MQHRSAGILVKQMEQVASPDHRCLIAETQLDHDPLSSSSWFFGGQFGPSGIRAGHSASPIVKGWFPHHVWPELLALTIVNQSRIRGGTAVRTWPGDGARISHSR